MKSEVTESICCNSKCYVASIWKIAIHEFVKTYHDKSMVMIIPADNLRFQLLDPGLVAEYFGHNENNTAVFQSHKYHNY